MVTDILDVLHVPLFLLYAEIHFRFFKFWPSFLARKEPEIIFDLPRRCVTPNKIPISLVINDISKYPADLLEVRIDIRSDTSKQLLIYDTAQLCQYKVKHPLEKQAQVYLFPIDTDSLPRGTVSVNCLANIKLRKRRKKILNDNLPTSSKAAFECMISDNPLPGNKLCSFGDVHVHSQYSQSHVEFGLPLAVLQAFGRAYGIDFMVITDHSYDLCCSIDDYLKPDPDLPRWKILQKQLLDFKGTRPVLCGGEEVSCLNHEGRVVHLGSIGNKTYIPGTLDGARSGRKKELQLSINQCVMRTRYENGLAFAAHPLPRAGWLQRLFLKRGHWSSVDISKEMSAFQAVNGDFGTIWKSSKTLWIKMLEKGFRLPLLAGNDSHGDCNRYRAIKIPFFSLVDRSDSHFAFCNTGIYGKVHTEESIISAIGKGKTFVTNGPFLGIFKDRSGQESVVSNSTVSLTSVPRIYIHATSTQEFGSLRWLLVSHFSDQTSGERQLPLIQIPPNRFSYTHPLDCAGFSGSGYIRAELWSKNSTGTVRQAATSPCYYSP